MTTEDIKLRIQAYEQQARMLDQELNKIKDPSTSPLSKALRAGFSDVLGETVGNFANGIVSDLGLRGVRAKTHVKNMLSEKSKSDEKKRLQEGFARINYSVNGLIDEIIRFVSQISINKSNLRPEGNSYQLIGMFNGIKSLQRPSYKISNLQSKLEMLKSLDLVDNQHVPVILNNGSLARSAPTKAYEILMELESNLRQLIKLRLSYLDPSWWNRFVPEDVRRRAVERKSRNERPWPGKSTSDEDLINYVDFADYSKILTKRDNWKNAFESVFKDEMQLASKLRELEPIRNEIAHSRKLTRRAHMKLVTYSEDILEAIHKNLGK